MVVGQGPSSKVSTSSLSASGSVCGNSLRPTRGVALDVDRERARGAERIRITGAGLRGGGQRQQQRGKRDDENATHKVASDAGT